MKHVKGKDCKTCCCRGPSKCYEPGCNGWVHQEVADEVQVDENDWEWVHNYKCDTCGKENYYDDDYSFKIEFE